MQAINNFGKEQLSDQGQFLSVKILDPDHNTSMGNVQLTTLCLKSWLGNVAYTC